MSQYASTIRTSYFKVRSPRDFEKFCDRFGLNVIRNSAQGRPNLHGFAATNSEQSLMSCFYDQEASADVEADIFLDDLSKHLCPGWTAIITEIGADGTNVLKGRAVALSAEGETRTADLYDIYELAKELGGTSTPCEG